MATIPELRAKRGELVDQWNDLLMDKGGNVRDDMSAEDEAKVKDLEAEVGKLDAKIAAAERARAAQAAQAVEVKPDASVEPAKAPAQAKPAFKGQHVARAIRSIALGHMTRRSSTEVAKDAYGDNAAPVQAVVKALESGQISPDSTSSAAGGYLVAQDYLAELIELLRPASVVMSLQPRVLPMPNGNLTIPGIATGSQASYVGENTNISSTEPTFREVTLAAKKLAAIVPVSNDLIRFASVAAEQAVLDDLVAAIAQRMDLAFLRGDGSSNTPKGLLSLVNVANKFNGTDLSGVSGGQAALVQAVRSDLGKAELKLEEANVPMLRAGWILAPRTRTYLADLTDTNGNRAFPEISDGMLRGRPFRVTSQVPTNLGSSPSKESEIYLADFAQVIVGESMGVQVSASDVAAYHDGANVQAAFSKDQTVIRGITEHDMGVRHDKAIAVIQAVTWGA